MNIEECLRTWKALSGLDPDDVEPSHAETLFAGAVEAISYLRSIRLDVAHDAYEAFRLSHGSLPKDEDSVLARKAQAELGCRPDLDTLEERLIRWERLLEAIKKELETRQYATVHFNLTDRASLLLGIRELAQIAYDCEKR